jgi:hypothetical protein
MDNHNEPPQGGLQFIKLSFREFIDAARADGYREIWTLLPDPEVLREHGNDPIVTISYHEHETRGHLLIVQFTEDDFQVCKPLGEVSQFLLRGFAMLGVTMPSKLHNPKRSIIRPPV